MYVCDRIHSSLEAHFGKDKVFFDKPSIKAGTRFAKRLQDVANSCAVMLAVMGKRWLTVSDEYGRRKIDDPKDWVTQELQTALNRNIVVIPVLIEHIDM